jgi:hypothetical protein
MAKDGELKRWLLVLIDVDDDNDLDVTEFYGDKLEADALWAAISGIVDGCKVYVQEMPIACQSAADVLADYEHLKKIAEDEANTTQGEKGGEDL